MLSPDVERGFSGEGQALEGLAASQSRQLLPAIRAQLKWQDTLSVHELAQAASIDSSSVEKSLSVLGTQGVVGFDLASVELTPCAPPPAPVSGRDRTPVYGQPRRACGSRSSSPTRPCQALSAVPI